MRGNDRQASSYTSAVSTNDCIRRSLFGNGRSTEEKQGSLNGPRDNHVIKERGMVFPLRFVLSYYEQ
jgi:hypothetical protein